MEYALFIRMVSEIKPTFSSCKWYNLPLLLCLAASEQLQLVECRVKTKPDALIAIFRIDLNHMVDLLNLQRLHWTMFRLLPKCRHLNLTRATHVTEIAKQDGKMWMLKNMNMNTEHKSGAHREEITKTIRIFIYDLLCKCIWYAVGCVSVKWAKRIWHEHRTQNSLNSNLISFFVMSYAMRWY